MCKTRKKSDNSNTNCAIAVDGSSPSHVSRINSLLSDNSYPPEAVGNPKRMKEWEEAHKRGELHIRANSKEEHRQLLRIKWWCQDNGTSTCVIFIDLSESLLEASDAVRPLKKCGSVVVNIQQQNTFVHTVQRFRRVADPGLLSFSKRDISGTAYRLAFEALVIQKALQISRNFCFHDFPELSPKHFRKLILHLKRKGKVAPVEPRTCPRFYRITPKLLMSIMPENTSVSPVGRQMRVG